MVVVTAPSGAGKSTLCGLLLREFPAFVYSVSCTTRAPRGSEEHGKAYFFLTEDAFLRRIEAGDFLEYAVVHGHHYGTLKETVAAAMTAGKSVILDIDVAGADQVRRIVADLPEDDPLKVGFLDVFIQAPSLEVLRSRMVKRGEDTPETIERRLKNAVVEMMHSDEFSHALINGDLDKTYAQFRNIVCSAATCRSTGGNGKGG